MGGPWSGSLPDREKLDANTLCSFHTKRGCMNIIWRIYNIVLKKLLDAKKKHHEYEYIAEIVNRRL